MFAGNTTQYNWVASTDKYSGTVETIRGYLFGGKENCDTDEFEYTYSDFIHKIDGVAYLNMGITQEKESYDVSENTPLEKVLSVSALTKSYHAWSIKSCGESCTHAFAPDDLTGDGVYTYLDFIEGRKK